MPDDSTRPAPRPRRARRDDVRTRALSPDAMLTQDHPARTGWAFTAGLDLATLDGAVRAVDGRPGRPHTDPRPLFALRLYATTDGVGSARGVSVYYHTLVD